MRDKSYKPPGSVILTIPIDPELHKRLRRLSVETERSLKDIGTAALENYLKGYDF